MANGILGSTNAGRTDALQFDANSPMGDIAAMLVQMDRAGRLTEPERDALRKHAEGARESMALMIRGVARAVMDSINEGNFAPNDLSRAVWSIDMMADALQGMQMLADDLGESAGVPNHA